MSTLSVASRDQMEAVYRESHALWGAGLSVADYNRMWEELQGTRWGSRWYRFLVWHDERGKILSSMKLYRPEVRLAGRTRRACAIGAVFTPVAERRRGHAARMIDRVVEEARAAGDAPAMLFSDIGARYYEALGFRALPAEEAQGTLPRTTRPPAGWRLRPMLPADLPAVMEAHDAFCEGRRIAVLRDRDHWEFLIERARRYFARYDGSDLELRYRVAERDGRFAGYVVAVDGGADWELREARAVGNDPETTATLLGAAASDARARGLRRVYGWIPRSQAALVPGWRIRFEPRLRAIPMLRPLDSGSADLAPLADPEVGFLPYLDQF